MVLIVLLHRYAHYDGNPSFSDFSSFGGWTSPHAKQYQGDVTACRYVSVAVVA